MFNRECRQKHARFIRNKLTDNALALSGLVLDAGVVGDPILSAKLAKLQDDSADIVQYLNTKLDAKEA